MTRVGSAAGTSTGDPLIGHLLDGRYEIHRRLARGGMATVYQAVDTRLTRTVAVKVMHVGLGDDADFARKFDREARAAAKLSHPNVVSVFDQGQARVAGDVVRPYIVMEYVAGHTLRDVINRESPVPPIRALELIDPVLSALAAAHDAGLVHRDIKPENVLISDRGQLKVADFGLAKAISSQTQTATQGLLIGTVSYLPPELVISGKADARSDVYSTGVVLFELLTGHKPHTGETPIQVAYAHVHTDIPPPSASRTAGPIPPYLDALIARATARPAELRPHDARVFLSEVRRVRAALRSGLADDVELTQDLSGLTAGPGGEPTQNLGTAPTQDLDGLTRPIPPRPDRADFESTQLVAQPPSSAYSPPTILDAPPPPPLPKVAPERIAANRARQARRRRRGWLVLLLVLLLTAIAALGGWYLASGRFTTAPDLRSMSRAEAEAVVGKADLEARFTDAYSEDVARGAVIGTEPRPGAKVRRGSVVEAALSLGPERYPMPRIRGLTQSAAEDAIQESHLNVGTVTAAYSETAASGIVIAASQDPGASLKPDTPINLVVSKGPAPVKVVDYRGKDADKARTALLKAGFRVASGKPVHSDKYAKGEVAAQSPKSGRHPKRTEITLIRSLGPVLVTVPQVRRMGVQPARETLRSAGFKVKIRHAINFLNLGYVVSTNPPALSRAPKGSTITLYVL